MALLCVEPLEKKVEFENILYWKRKNKNSTLSQTITQSPKSRDILEPMSANRPFPSILTRYDFLYL